MASKNDTKPGPAKPPGKVFVPPGGGRPVVINPPKPGQDPDPGYTQPIPEGDFSKYLEGEERDAYLALHSLFKSYGLESLARNIYNYIVKGYSADTIQILLQDTKEWKERFSGNEERKRLGLAVLSPSDYLNLEATYRGYLQEAGLPKGFYDQPKDFSEWIGKGVSPKEVQDRVEAAKNAVYGNPEYRQALKQLYGLSDSDLAAYWLDPDRALPLIQKQARAAEIGAQALAHGFKATGTAIRLAGEGITAEQAKQGYAWIADTFSNIRAIAERYGTDWTQGQAEQAVFEPGRVFDRGEAASKKQQRLLEQERGLFSGSTGASSGGLRAGGGQGGY